MNVMASSKDSESYVLMRNSLHRAVAPSSMSSYDVSAMAQDDRGMLWFGATNGLFYFDNYTFSVYDWDNVLNSTINSMVCVGNSILVGADSGLWIVDVNEKKTSNILDGIKVNVICKSCDNIIMVGTDDGLFKLDMDDDGKMFVENVGGDFPLIINDVEYDKSGDTWWLATNDGIFIMVQSGYFKKENDLVATTICVMEDNQIYAGNENGLFKVDSETGDVTVIPLQNNVNSMVCPDVSDIIIFDDDEIFVATRGSGVFRYNVYNHSTVNITRYGTVEMSLSDDYTSKLFKDSTGRFWIATALGINSMMRDFSNFTSMSLMNVGPHSLPVRSIAQKSGYEMFMGTDNGVFVFNKNNNTYKTLEDYYSIDNHKLESARVSSMCFDRGRYLWVGTRYRGVSCFDTKNKSFINWLPDLSNQIINDIVSDRHGGIWLSTSKGVIKIDIFEKTYENICYGSSNGILCDGNVVYVTMNHSLLRYNSRTRESELFELDGINTLYNITKGNDGLLYIGSYQGGVVTFNVNTRKFGVFKNADDGVSPIAYAVLFDSEGTAWVSSNLGIWSCDIKTGVISKYDATDGLQGNDFTMNGAVQDSSGMMYFGGYNGFSMFNPLNIKLENTEPKLMVSNIHNGLGNDNMNIHDGDTLTFGYYENTFIIDFSAYNLYKINKIKYRYILEGYDNQWGTGNSSRHNVEYRNLPSGTYTFILMATNEANIENKDPYEVTIIVKPQWYDTMLFRVIVGLSFMVIAMIIVVSVIFRAKRKIRHVNEINELERKMFQLKGKALQMQMNPHFLYNTLNSIQSFIMTNEPVKASMYLSSFAKLMRKILNNASRDRILLSEELELIKLYLDLEKLRLNDRFDYKIIVDPQIRTDKVEIASMLLQPFAENAVIHGLAYKAAEGLLKIEVKDLGKNHIMIVVEDNGIGRSKASQIRRELGKTEQSHATSITKQRLEILNEVSKGEYSVNIVDLYDENNVSNGTRVEIKICYHD